jgi:hypothetical protein
LDTSLFVVTLFVEPVDLDFNQIKSGAMPFGIGISAAAPVPVCNAILKATLPAGIAYVVGIVVPYRLNVLRATKPLGGV